MKKILLLFLAVLLTSFLDGEAGAAKYKLNNQKVDGLFETATSADIGMLHFSSLNMKHFETSEVQEKDPMVAILLDIFVGTLGVHRFYLGTKTMTGIGYILTCGGIFGVVPLVDLIVLAVDYEDISPYVDNPAFFMW